MSRFSATAPEERRDLFAGAIRAHQERGSAFVTFEAETEGDDPVPWVQVAGDDGLLNLDCTDAELPAVEAAISSFGGATIVDRTAPEEAEGTNLRVTVDGDAERLAMLVQTVFQDGFGVPEGTPIWVTEL